ncbi:hypothetical protein QAD02_011703 [Eretmocerus hayati]|uniref:Uncharacterized protein n=1 Tax=Eretmocerus hayati TaxID=131215 RepID=A0ACC2NXR9_9HYME|nr:hypothetical protein QAD02_011703 [Eretmocerus hayati]
MDVDDENDGVPLPVVPALRVDQAQPDNIPPVGFAAAAAPVVREPLAQVEAPLRAQRVPRVRQAADPAQPQPVAVRPPADQAQPQHGAAGRQAVIGGRGGVLANGVAAPHHNGTHGYHPYRGVRAGRIVQRRRRLRNFLLTMNVVAEEYFGRNRGRNGAGFYNLVSDFGKKKNDVENDLMIDGGHGATAAVVTRVPLSRDLNLK